MGDRVWKLAFCMDKFKIILQKYHNQYRGYRYNIRSNYYAVMSCKTIVNPQCPPKYKYNKHNH
jgi:hypothetical protein